jgi:MMP 1-O-methyltransferase
MLPINIVRPLVIDLPLDVNSVKGFLHEDEGAALYQHALAAAAEGAVLEVGSYCGKSTLYLGTACRPSSWF